MPDQHAAPPYEEVTISEAATRLGVTPHTVRRYIRDGKLPVKIYSRRVRLVIWSEISAATLAAIAAAADAARAADRRDPESCGATMRRSRPDDPSGT